MFRTLRQIQTQPVPQVRPLRTISRFTAGIPSIQLQLSTAQAPTTSAAAAANPLQQQQQAAVAASFRTTTLPYNTLNEILQGYETPASALQQQPATIITAPSATSFMDLLTGAAAGGANALGHHTVNAGATGGTFFKQIFFYNI